MVFFELYATKPRLKRKGGETLRIFYTNSSRMINVIIVYHKRQWHKYPAWL